MHPLIITALYPPAVGGAATYFSDIAPKLAQSDQVDRLTILTERMPDQARNSMEDGVQLLRYLPTRNSLGQRPWLIHATTYLLTQLWFAVYFPVLVKKHQIDLIHFHTRYRGRFFFNALQRCNVPVVADLRDKMTEPAELIDTVDRLLCCGEGVQHFAIEGGFPTDRTALVPIPFRLPKPMPSEEVNKIFQKYRLECNKPFLLFVGDMTRNKGVYELLQAYQQWRVDHQQVQLVMVGPNRLGEPFEAQVRQVPNVRYLGALLHSDVLALMQTTEVLILPSRSEGLPRVILEALALGTKVICPPNIPEFTRNLPQFVLDKVSTDDIIKKLHVVWHHQNPPVYPFSDHDLTTVVEKLLVNYAHVLGN